MQDPKVKTLSEKLSEKVAEVNVIWQQLQQENVYVRFKEEGGYNVTDPEYRTMKIENMTQNVEYLEKENE